MEPVSHTYVVPSWFSIEYQANVIITNSLRTGIGASNHAVAGFLFILPPCDAHNIAVQKITQTFNGPKSGCTQLAGTCAVGEPINFAIAAAEPTADPCDYWFVDWGDGTRPETFIIGDPTAQISPHHFFATTGKFVATFTLQPTGTRLSAESIAQVLPSASATVYVTPTGSPAGGKRRSVRP